MIDLGSLDFWAGAIAGSVFEVIVLTTLLIVVAWKRMKK